MNPKWFNRLKEEDKVTNWQTLTDENIMNNIPLIL